MVKQLSIAETQDPAITDLDDAAEQLYEALAVQREHSKADAIAVSRARQVQAARMLEHKQKVYQGFSRRLGKLLRTELVMTDTVKLTVVAVEDEDDDA